MESYLKYLLLIILSTSLFAADAVDNNDVLMQASTKKKTWDLTQEQRDNYSNLALLAAPVAISIYGITAWGWITHGMKFRARDEKWLQRNTYVGGVDKISHTYSHFMITMGYYNIYEKMGLSPREANFKAMAGAGITGLVIELGDGVSHYGFSWGDLMADSVGIAFAGLINAYPCLDELIGFQVQWWPRGAPADHPTQKIRSPIDDYNNQKYVLNLKASGIGTLKEHWATRYLNLDFGYYTRGYKNDKANPDNNPELFDRSFFMGMSLNLSKLFETKYTVASTIFKYYQTPFNSVQFDEYPLH